MDTPETRFRNATETERDARQAEWDRREQRALMAYWAMIITLSASLVIVALIGFAGAETLPGNETLTCIPAAKAAADLEVARREGYEVFALSGAEARAYLGFVNGQEPPTDFKGDGVIGAIGPKMVIFGILSDDGESLCLRVAVSSPLHKAALKAAKAGA